MNDSQILVSIIVPVHNAKDYLTHSLPAIRASDYPHYELIVVDDDSTDDSSEFAKKYANIVLKMHARSTGKARNKGAQASKGSILFFTDADVLIAPDTVSRVVKALRENPEIVAVLGSYDEKPLFNSFFSQYKDLFHHFIHQNANPEANTFWAGCGAVWKDAFFGVGGFTERFSSASIDDVELGYKLVENGKKIRLLKDLQVTHCKKWNFITLLKTDIVHRAIPWTILAHEKGLPLDLNFKLSDRISGIIACFLFVSLILMWQWNALVPLSITSAGILLYLNRNLYKFFLKKRGARFMIGAILLHWFYFLYSSVTFALFSVYFLLKDLFVKKTANGKNYRTQGK